MTFIPRIPPEDPELRGQIEYLKDEGNKAPRRGPGDKYIILGTVAGIIGGLVIGLTAEPVFLIFGPIIGGVAGAFVGSVVKRLAIRSSKPS